VIPKEARAALGVKAGDKLLVIVRNEQVIVLQKPKSYQAAIRGLAQGVYPKGYFEKNGKAGTRSAAGLPPAARRIAL
jgi:AbrB family looped-hinge helix DNA binding protein